MKIRNNMLETIGATPLVRLRKIEHVIGNQVRLLGKMECFNPGGSAKDRAALSMIVDAEEKGRLVAGSVIIEPTSGNTGVALAAIGAQKGYAVILTMPETMSVERRNILKAYGAKLVLTPGSEGMKGAIAEAEKILKDTPHGFMPSQFTNGANANAHYKTTGPEIWEATEGKIHGFIAGVGTGGTISGVGQYLKEQNPSVQVVGVEPEASQVLGKGQAGPHGIQGIGAGFVPEILNRDVMDRVVSVTEEEAYKYGRMMAREEGLLVGISSGAAIAVAMKVGQLPENKGTTWVVLLPDTGERYLSTKMFQEVE